jgi:hypothetical protein
VGLDEVDEVEVVVAVSNFKIPMANEDKEKRLTHG